MAKGDKYTWTFSGRQRTWAFAIQKEGFTTTATGMLAGAEAFLTWGKPSNELSDTLLPCDIRVEVVDPNLTLYNDLLDQDLEEDDFRLVATDSTGTFTIRMRVRLDTVETYLVPNLNEQITSLYGYCGLSELKNIDAILLTSRTIHKTFRDILSLSLISQNIEYLTGIYPTNIASADPVLDLVRLNRLDLIFAEAGRKIDNMADQLQGLVDGFGVTAFNGLDGQWHVKHRWGLGETITSGRGKQRYYLASNTLVSLNTLSQTTLTVTKPIIQRNTTRRILKPVQAIEIERGSNRDFITVDLARHGDFETGWTSGTEHEVWTVNSGSIAQSAKSDTGTYALRVDDGLTSVETVIDHFAGSSQVFIEIAFRYAMEYLPAGSGSGTLTITAIFDPIDPGEAINYTATAGTWAADAIANTFTATQTPEANGTSPLTYSTYNQVIEAPLPPVDGKLSIRFQGDGNNNYYVYVDNFEVRINNTSSESVSKFRSTFPRVLGGIDFFSENIATRGEIVSQSRSWFNGTLGVDTDGDGTRDELIEMLQADTDGAGTWTQPSKWTNEGYLYTDTYDDVAKATSDARIGEQDKQVQVIEGEILGIVTPETPFAYDGKTYIPVYASIDLKREITKVTAVEKLKTFNVIDGLPTTLYFLTDQREVRSATIDLDNTGWSTATLFTVTSRTITRNLRVDPSANNGNGYVFVAQFQFATAWYIRRHALDGTGATDVWTDASVDGLYFDIDRDNEYLILITDDTTNLVRRYDYDGNLVDSHTATSSTTTGSVGVSEDKSYCVYTTRSGATVTQRKMIFSTSSESSLGTSFTGNSTVTHIDTDVDRIFHRNDDGGSEYIGYTSLTGGSRTDIETLQQDGGLAIDRYNQLLYWGDATDIIKEFDYDGASERTVIDISGETGSNAIVSIDLGV